jgi:hypothetical protein
MIIMQLQWCKYNANKPLGFRNGVCEAIVQIPQGAWVWIPSFPSATQRFPTKGDWTGLAGFVIEVFHLLHALD